MVITTAASSMMAQDTTPPPPPVIAAPPPAPVPAAPLSPPEPTIEQIRYQEGLKTATRGVAQLRDGLNRVARTQSSDSLTKRRATRRLGGLCGAARSFIVSGRPKMQASAYADSMQILAKQLTTRLDTLSRVLPICEKTVARDPTVVNTLTTRLQKYDDALTAFRNALKPDSTKAVSQQ
ncbi:MAG: hypothetical protein ACREMI_10365 [Gemmatimonadales bacterium]